MTSTAIPAGARGSDRRQNVVTSRWFREPGSFDAFFNKITEEADHLRAQLQRRERQPSLFGNEAQSLVAPPVAAPARDVKGLVSRAYLSLLRRMPEDHVVIHPEANREYLTRCQLLGLGLPEYVLNRTLLNVRKAGWHTGLDRGAGDVLSPVLVDSVGFAAEIAVRVVQLQVAELGLFPPSIDHVLCDPELRSAFDETAQRLSPGAAVYEYRLAALAYRKSGRESRQRLSSTSEPDWQLEVPLAKLDLADAPEGPCVYRIGAGGRTVFLASTLNLRNRLLTHLQVGAGRSIVPIELYDLPSKDLRVRWFETPPTWRPRRADAVAWRLKVKSKSLLNLYARAS